jgi:Flp pilus assembly protein TadG
MRRAASVFGGLQRIAGRFRADAGGTVAVLFAILLPILLGAVGSTIDYVSWARQQMLMQSAADAAALSAARELQVGAADERRVDAVARSIVLARLDTTKTQRAATVTATLQDAARVRVEIRMPRQDTFTQLFGIAPGEILVGATAILSRHRKLCVLALDARAAQTVHLKSNSWLTARGCDVHSNADHAQGITSDSGIQVTAATVCSSGGFSGQGSFRGTRVSGCPALPDPLAERAALAPGVCKTTNAQVVDLGSSGNRHRLTPGTYCGGLFIGGNAMVSFEPGEYVISGGPLTFDSNADVVGDGVGFFLTGANARFRFLSNAKVDLDAPVGGPLAGLLFYEDRGAGDMREHEIKSNYVANMTGTIYLPKGRLVVDATNEVAQQSYFTVIVARQILLTANPKLIVNVNYGLTRVPVPKGLGPLTGDVSLAD